MTERKPENVRIKITLNATARAEAVAMRKVRGIETPDDFEGPVFDNVELSDITDGFFAVKLATGERYAYNVNTIARIACYNLDALASE